MNASIEALYGLGIDAPNVTVQPLTEEHRADLIDKHAVTSDVIREACVQSWAEGTVHLWSDGTARLLQCRRAPEHRRPETPKYFGPERPIVINHLREPEGRSPIILAEGTLQHLSVASYAPTGLGVYGMYGCWGWSRQDLSWAEGRDVILMPDADLTTNQQVWDAMKQIRDALGREGASSVKLVAPPGRRKDGIDDVLARRASDSRAAFLARLLAGASESLGKRPAKNANDPLKIATKLRGQHHMAVSAEKTVAIYTKGVYRTDPEAFNALMTVVLGADFSRGFRDTVHDFIKGQLYSAGRFIPGRVSEPVLNVPNGLLDLRTGERREHDPDHLSAAQIPVAWEPDATCPMYDAWLKDMAGDQADDLEEVASTMLDPSRTPTKAIFLYGPPRSGKSTFLRIMRAIAGGANTSAVGLADLAENKFAAANVYGKILNASAELGTREVQDTRLFRLMTGEDVITADRKYGHQFEFTNQALFAFCANEIPTVGEGNSAYQERIKPFRFGNSFAGHEDDSIERKIMEELPGILARWVTAWQRKNNRGAYLPTVAEIATEFATKSDRVAEWITECCEIVTHGRERTSEGVAETAVTPGSLQPDSATSTTRELFKAFIRWVDDAHGPRMGERQFKARLNSINGVMEVRRKSNKAKALNVVVREGVVEVAVWRVKDLLENTRAHQTSTESFDFETATSATGNGECSNPGIPAADPLRVGSEIEGSEERQSPPPPVAPRCGKCGFTLADVWHVKRCHIENP